MKPRKNECNDTATIAVRIEPAGDRRMEAIRPRRAEWRFPRNEWSDVRVQQCSAVLLKHGLTVQPGPELKRSERSDRFGQGLRFEVRLSVDVLFM